MKLIVVALLLITSALGQFYTLGQIDSFSEKFSLSIRLTELYNPLDTRFTTQSRPMYIELTHESMDFVKRESWK